jgi:hypothetical protein
MFLWNCRDQDVFYRIYIKTAFDRSEGAHDRKKILLEYSLSAGLISLKKNNIATKLNLNLWIE